MRKLSQKILGGTGAFAIVSTLATVVVNAQSYRYDYDYTPVDAATGGALGIGVIAFYLCVCCISLVIPLVCAYVVYKDAQKNNVENGVLWAVVAFFFNLIGLLVYFLAIKPEAVKKNSGLNNMVTEVKHNVENKVDDVKRDL